MVNASAEGLNWLIIPLSRQGASSVWENHTRQRLTGVTKLREASRTARGGKALVLSDRGQRFLFSLQLT